MEEAWGAGGDGTGVRGVPARGVRPRRKEGSPVSHAVVHPVGGANALIGRRPVIQARVQVQAVEQVGGGPDNPAGEGEEVGVLTPHGGRHAGSHRHLSRPPPPTRPWELHGLALLPGGRSLANRDSPAASELRLRCHHQGWLDTEQPVQTGLGQCVVSRGGGGAGVCRSASPPERGEDPAPEPARRAILDIHQVVHCVLALGPPGSERLGQGGPFPEPRPRGGFTPWKHRGASRADLGVPFSQSRETGASLPPLKHKHPSEEGQEGPGFRPC